MLVFVVKSSEEDDWHPSSFFSLLYNLSQLEAGHARHPDVQDEECEFLDDEREQCLVGGLGPHQSVARIVQNGFEHR